jgi:hypothetical protein
MAATMTCLERELGFAVAGTAGDLPSWASMVRDDCEIMLVCGEFPLPAQDWAAYLYVDDADAMHAEFASRGAAIVRPPVDKPYNLREFEVRLPDGRLLAFGGPIPAGQPQ